MRPTGVVLIALYHFLGAFLLLLLALALLLGGSVLGAMFGGMRHSFIGGLGLLAGVVGGVFFFGYAIVVATAGFGLWSLREWARILSIVLAVISLLFSLPGLLVGLPFHLFFGGYRLFRIVISISIIWYLMQPPIRALFQRTASAT